MLKTNLSASNLSASNLSASNLSASNLSASDLMISEEISEQAFKQASDLNEYDENNPVSFEDCGVDTYGIHAAIHRFNNLLSCVINNLQEIKMAEHLVPSILIKEKTVTIRQGYRDITLGPAKILSTDLSRKPFLVDVREVRHKQLNYLCQDELDGEGAKSIEEMHSALLQYYPNITMSSEITVIFFEVPGHVFVD